MYTVGHDIWQEYCQTKMRNSCGRNWKMSRNTEKREK